MEPAEPAPRHFCNITVSFKNAIFWQRKLMVCSGRSWRRTAVGLFAVMLGPGMAPVRAVSISTSISGFGSNAVPSFATSSDWVAFPQSDMQSITSFVDPSFSSAFSPLLDPATTFNLADHSLTINPGFLAYPSDLFSPAGTSHLVLNDSSTGGSGAGFGLVWDIGYGDLGFAPDPPTQVSSPTTIITPPTTPDVPVRATGPTPDIVPTGGPMRAGDGRVSNWTRSLLRNAVGQLPWSTTRAGNSELLRSGAGGPSRAIFQPHGSTISLQRSIPTVSRPTQGTLSFHPISSSLGGSLFLDLSAVSPADSSGGAILNGSGSSFSGGTLQLSGVSYEPPTNQYFHLVMASNGFLVPPTRDGGLIYTNAYSSFTNRLGGFIAITNLPGRGTAVDPNADSGSGTGVTASSTSQIPDLAQLHVGEVPNTFGTLVLTGDLSTNFTVSGSRTMPGGILLGDPNAGYPDAPPPSEAPVLDFGGAGIGLIPEPGTWMWLALAGAASLAVRRRRGF